MKWCSAPVSLTGLEAGVAGVCPASEADRPRWFLATHDGVLRGVDLDDGATFFETRLPFALLVGESATLVASADGRYLAVVQTRGLEGALYDVAQGTLLRALVRADYHADASGWALALVKSGERDVLITATAWNRLEAFALPSLERLAPAGDDTDLDYFFGHASPSPSGRQLASFGWHWQPVGALRVMDVEAWLTSRADAPPELHDSLFAEWWDDDVCWLDEGRIALRGQQPEDAEDSFLAHSEGVLIVDLATRKIERAFPGLSPRQLATDGNHLLMLGQTTRVFSLATGAELASLDQPTHAWHPGARVALTLPALGGAPGPCALHWLTGTLGHRAALPEAPTAPRLLVLADALEEAGGPPEAVAHCRTARSHGRRCWVIEGLR